MERIGRDVEHALRRTGGGAGFALAEITAAWPGTVGDAISRNAWPLRLGRDGTLHVATASATWAFELDRMGTEIRERLSAVLGEQAPAALRFRVGPVPEPVAASHGTVKRESKESAPTDPQVTSEAAAAAAEIEDPELRQLVARAARASLSKPSSGRRF
jgi:hypothetical protein